MYARWAELNEEQWRLDDDQVKSAAMLLTKMDGEEVEIIPITQEDGIHAIAFTFKDVLEKIGKQIIEIAMDSTCNWLFCCLTWDMLIVLIRENECHRI